MTAPGPADPALENSPFDRGLRRLRRDRAARSGAEANPLLRRIADDLLDRLDLVTRRFEHALDLGTGPGLLAAALRAQGMQVTACDAGAVFSRAGGEQCDEDRLPFEPGSFDLVVSAGTLDSVNDLPGALIQVRRPAPARRPVPGRLCRGREPAGAAPGRSAAADEAEQRPASPRLHPQIDLRAPATCSPVPAFALPGRRRRADDRPLFGLAAARRGPAQPGLDQLLSARSRARSGDWAMPPRRRRSRRPPIRTAGFRSIPDHPP
jgi:hypothetical protein